jgi:uncharacterized protein YcbK (DUF882 family)
MDHRGASRRRILRLGMAGLAGLLVPVGRAAAADARILSLRSVHTGEWVRATYWAAGRYVRDGLIEIDRLLRDHRSNTVHPIDRRLLDVLGALRDRLETREPFEVISGYRSPAKCPVVAPERSPRRAPRAGAAVDIRCRAGRSRRCMPPRRRSGPAAAYPDSTSSTWTSGASVLVTAAGSSADLLDAAPHLFEQLVG